jgi:hypothetical protein
MQFQASELCANIGASFTLLTSPFVDSFRLADQHLLAGTLPICPVATIRPGYEPEAVVEVTGSRLL